jgi:hypothetical protein
LRELAREVANPDAHGESALPERQTLNEPPRAGYYDCIIPDITALDRNP